MKDTEGEVFYRIEYSVPQADDWFAAHTGTDSLDSAQKLLSAMKEKCFYDYRIVRVTITEEIIPEVLDADKES